MAEDMSGTRVDRMAMAANDIARLLPSGVLSTLNGGRIQGWVSQPDYRGTMDIIWSCFITIFICTYTILCLNVPSHHDGFGSLLRRKLMWMGLAIIGPEFVLTYAAGQWSRAHHSLKAFHNSGFREWTLRQAFFADMGGFVLHPRDSPTFPLNAKQLHWLVVNHFVEYPATVTDDEIADKSKQDRIAKVITTFQIGFLILQSIGRAAQHLAITTLELNTLAIVVCSVMTSIIWLHKPTDVRKPVPIHSSFDILEISGGRTWRHTPLDFVDENGPGWAINVQPFMKMPVIPAERPIQRIPNDRFPMDPYGSQEYFLCFATLLFSAIHVTGWNFTFPTTTERLLWRIASMLLFAITAAFWLLETVASWKRLGRWKWLYYKLMAPSKLPEFEKANSRKPTGLWEPKELPLPWEFWTIFPLALIYGVARLYLIAEGLLELRELPATALLNVQWSSYLPHIS